MSDSKESTETAVAGHAREHDHRLLRRTLAATLVVAFALYCLAAGLFLALRYLVLPRIDDFRPQIEALVSARLHADLKIGKLAPYWAGAEPGVDVRDLTIRDAQGTLALRVPHATATLSWASLMRFKPALASLVVEAPDVLASRAPDGSVYVAGVQVPTVHTGTSDTFSTWLLSQQTIVLRGGTLRWRDALRDAPELALHNIRLAILNSGIQHRVALQAPPDGTVLKGPLDFRARFHHLPLFAVGKPQNWNGEAYLSTGPVDLPALARYVRVPIRTYAGRIGNTLWARFSGGNIRAAQGRLQGSDVVLRVRPTQPQLDLPAVRFGWAIDIDPQRDYQLRLTGLRAELGQPPLADGTPVSRTLSFETLAGHYRVPTVAHGQLMSVTGDRVDLGILAEFTRALPVPRRFLDELVRFDPRGMVANYLIEVERARPADASAASEERVGGTAPVIRYRARGDLLGISVAAQEPPPGLSPAGHPRTGLPGFENLWGRIDADETRGTLSVDTVHAAVTVPGQFDDPRLSFDRLRARGEWTVTPAPGQPHKSFSISVPELSVENADTAGTVSATYSNPGHGRGTLDLKATLARARVPRIARYLPTSIGDHLRHYLGNGLQDGVTRNATIEVHGGLDKFPYSREPGAGVFRIVAPFTGGKFDPSPYPPKTLKDGTPDVWPAIDGIDGVFTLKENVLRFDIDRAHYERVALTRVTGRIDDLGSHASSLVIEGEAHGPLADFLDYVNRSAVAGMTGHVSDGVRAGGNATLALTLTVPRTQEPHVSVKGTVGLADGSLVAPQLPPLEHLTGHVQFTEHTLALDHVAGRWLGGDVRADGALEANGTYAFDASGRIAADSARELDLEGPVGKILGHVYGDAPYAVTVRGAKGRTPQIVARSDLTGLALDLPAPLGKPLGAPMPFALSVKPPAAGEASGADARTDLRLGPVAATYLLHRAPERPQAGAKLQVMRGAIGIGTAPQLPADGVSVTAELATFDADAWRTLASEIRAARTAGSPVASGAATAPGRPRDTAARTPLAAQFAPDRFALHTDTLKLLNRAWNNVRVDALRSGDDWRAKVDSDEVAGDLSWQPGTQSGQVPQTAGVLHAHLTKATIPVTEGQHLIQGFNATPASQIPAIDVVVDELTVRGHSLGKLAVQARNLEEDGVPVWQLQKLELTNPAAHLLANANWRTARRLGTSVDDATPRRTIVGFKLDIADAGALLDRLGLPRTVKAGSGSLEGKFGWRGGPTAVDYPSLAGQLSLDMHHGQILKVDPGVAKLLGVLSLQSLTRVLTLNFKDVIGQGLPFERVTGTAQVENGIARTDDFHMKTAPFSATLAGTVDLAQETQDLRVGITPTINAGSAVIAAAVLNPLLGLGAFVANYALAQSISHAFATEYAVTGSWTHPQIERLSGDRGKMAAPAGATDR